MMIDASVARTAGHPAIAHGSARGQTSHTVALMTCTWLALAAGWQRAFDAPPAWVALWFTNAALAGARAPVRPAQRHRRAPRHRVARQHTIFGRDNAVADQTRPLRRPAPADIRRTGLCGKADPQGLSSARPDYAQSPISLPGQTVKTMLDQAIATIAIVLLTPLLLTIALAIRLDSNGPVIFRQRRHGQGNRPFMVLKFRTMTQDASLRGDGGVQTRRSDSRVTRVGRFLRTTSLDELPQLFNVLNGSMSLVGPRPHPIAMRTEGRLGHEIIPAYGDRHMVKPGITGWAQINGYRGATDTVEQLRRRVEHDLYYIDNWSLWLDLRILVLTPLRILFDRGNAF